MMKKKLIFICTLMLALALNIQHVSAKSYTDINDMAYDLISEIIDRQLGLGEFEDLKVKDEDYELIPYNDIMRQREGLVDVRHQFFAEVQQYDEAEDLAEGLFMRDGDLDQAYYFIFPILPDQRLMTGDQVDVYGTLKGLLTYETVLGGTKTVPVILVEKVLIEGLDY